MQIINDGRKIKMWFSYCIFHVLKRWIRTFWTWRWRNKRKKKLCGHEAHSSQYCSTITSTYLVDGLDQSWEHVNGINCLKISNWCGNCVIWFLFSHQFDDDHDADEKIAANAVRPNELRCCDLGRKNIRRWWADQQKFHFVFRRMLRSDWERMDQTVKHEPSQN